MTDPRILSEMRLERQLSRLDDVGHKLVIDHIAVLTEERDRLLNRAMVVMGDSLEWECDCAVCEMVREMVLLK